MVQITESHFWNNLWLLIGFTATLVAIFSRYWLVAYVYKSLVNAYTKSKRNLYALKRNQIVREIKQSFVSSVIAAAITTLSFRMYQLGQTKIYTNLDAYTMWYFGASALALMLLYETYYYWLHRLLHVPFVFKLIHKVHHESLHPTVFTSFAFHPLEALFQFIFFPVIIMLIPLHYSILIVVLTLMTISAVINHSGVEIMKKRYLLKYIIGSTHHDLHHTKFNANFGLYFTWWDRWMKTECKP